MKNKLNKNLASKSNQTQNIHTRSRRQNQYVCMGLLGTTAGVTQLCLPNYKILAFTKQNIYPKLIKG